MGLSLYYSGRRAPDLRGRHERTTVRQVYAGLTLVHRVGAGTFVGLTATSASSASVALDRFGWLHVPVHPMSAAKLIRVLLMVAGVLPIVRR